jgi:restriction system protein
MARRKQKINIIPMILILIWLIIFGKILHNQQETDTIASTILIAIVIIIFGTLSVLIILWYLRIQKRAKLRAALLAAGTENPMQLTPEQYEQFCATILLNNGWNARLTKKSGDFGADIIADKADHKLVIQCKQWSKSVGIKAVQEVHAALTHYSGSQAIVVTTTGYTQAAKDLAKSTGVRLLSHSDLVDM